MARRLRTSRCGSDSTLSSVAASEGQFEAAEKIASAAVQEALAIGLETIAADGLVDLTGTLSQLGRLTEARAKAGRALQLAEQRGARRTIARAKVQLAAVQEAQNQPREALATIGGVLPFLKSKSYRRFELYALSVASRAHERLDELEQARQISSEGLSVAETVKDESQIARAANNLASVTATLGHYADALRLRERAEAIHKRQGDKASLPYDLANRADLLIRLGRGDQAAAALEEIDKGIADGLPAYQSRARRLAFLRLFAAATALRCDEVDRRFVSSQWTTRRATPRAWSDRLSRTSVAPCCADGRWPSARSPRELRRASFGSRRTGVRRPPWSATSPTLP